MSSCCSRKRTVKDLFFLPIAVGSAFLGLGVLLALEISIAYIIGVL